jgi:hypothetical protein
MKRLMHISRSFAQTVSRAGRSFYRDPQAFYLMLRMAWWVAALSLLVKVLPLPRVLKLMSPRPSRVPAREDKVLEDKLAKLLDRVLAADWLVFTPTCWKRAAVLHRYLALSGIETRIVFGVNKESEGLLTGHAWLEAEGRPILEKSFPNFTVTYSFPA